LQSPRSRYLGGGGVNSTTHTPPNTPRNGRAYHERMAPRLQEHVASATRDGRRSEGVAPQIAGSAAPHPRRHHRHQRQQPRHSQGGSQPPPSPPGMEVFTYYQHASHAFPERGVRSGRDALIYWSRLPIPGEPLPRKPAMMLGTPTHRQAPGRPAPARASRRRANGGLSNEAELRRAWRANVSSVVR